MALKKYFDILGLPDTASPIEIRKQFRKLAMRYHPDKNPSPNAKEKFLLITDAYEILIGKKMPPVKTGTHISKSKEKTHEERVKKAKKRFHDQILKERSENERYFKSLFKGRQWKILRITSILGPVLSLFLLADMILPHHYEKDRLAYYGNSLKTGELLSNNALIRTENKNDYWISGLNFKLYGEYPDVLIESSWFYHEPIHVISLQKIRYAYYPIHYTFYSLNILVVIIFCLPLFINLNRRKKVWYTVLYHFSLYFTTGLIIVFLLTNDHWAHLLTFGFL